MKNRQRFLSIEFFKSLGIIYLICLHEAIWIFADLTRGGLRYPQAQAIADHFGFYSGLHVLGFQVPLLAGMTFVIALRTKNLRFFDIGKRAALLFFFGCMINFFCWGYYAIFAWDVLQFIALSMIVSFPGLVKYPKYQGPLILMIIGCVALSYSNLLPFQRFENFYLYHIIFGSPAGEHYWTFCPWYSVFALGLLMGEVYYQRDHALVKILPLFGMVLILISMLSGTFFPVGSLDFGWSMLIFKPAATFVYGILGFSLVFVPLVSWVFYQCPRFRTIVEKSPLMDLSRAILWIFLFNSIVGYKVTYWIINNFSLSFLQAQILWAVLFLGTVAGGCVFSHYFYLKKKIGYTDVFDSMSKD